MTAREPRTSLDRGPSGTVVGETKPTRNGYFARVELVYFEQGGTRVRIVVLKRAGAGNEFIRSIDITQEIAEQLWPIVREAAKEGR